MFLAKLAPPWPRFLTDHAPLEVEARMTTLRAEGVMVVDGRRGQFRTAFLIAATLPPEKTMAVHLWKRATSPHCCRIFLQCGICRPNDAQSPFYVSPEGDPSMMPWRGC